MPNRLLACLAGAVALVLVAGCGTSTEKVIDSSTAAPEFAIKSIGIE